MKIADILVNKTNWCQGSIARDYKGKPVRIDDPTAYSFDLLGALSKIHHDYQPMLADFKRIEAYTGGDMVAWNDKPGRTFEEVMALVKRLDL